MRVLIMVSGVLLLATLLAAGALIAPTLVSARVHTTLPPSLITHSILLVLSVVLAFWFSHGRLADFGFTRGTYRFTPRFLLLILPTATLSLLQYSAVGSGAHYPPGVKSLPELIVLVWIYASVCEEVFVRGFLQSALTQWTQRRFMLIGRRSLSLPVLLGAVFFGAMHIVLWPKLGALALVPMILATLLGIVAGYYREKTGSLLPAILVHALFNIGGSLPL